MKKPIEDKSQPQAEKFRAMAKELEADGDEREFDAKLVKLSKAKPSKGK